MTKVLKYDDKVIILTPYLTSKERDLLLYTSTEYDFDVLLEIVRANIKINAPYSFDDLSYLEKKYILLELRQISVGEVWSFIKKCHKCEEKYEVDLQYTNIVTSGSLDSIYGIEINEAYSDDYNDYISFDIDELDTDVYDKVVEYIDTHKTKFNFDKKIVCNYCKNEDSIKLSADHIAKNLSEDTLPNFYQSINSMVFYGHYTKLDIDSMIPFERSIYLSLLNEEIKKSNPGGA